MNEIVIKFDNESPQEKNKPIEISVDSSPEQNLLYKFFIGNEGVWETVKDFSSSTRTIWTPQKDSKYTVMIQAKKEGSSKPFDYISRVDYVVGKTEEKIIKDIILGKSILRVGEKLNVSVTSNKQPVVYKYWIKEKDNWELIRDYSADSEITFTVKQPGIHEVMVECRTLDSKNNFDDFKKAQFEVQAMNKLEITNFQCLTTELLVGNELLFQVDASYEDSRMVLYKFIKINAEGASTCVQDYSTKRIIGFTESESGSYKLLCLAKDMYSPKEYDDRAIISYEVKLYKPVTIVSFTSDLSSPQLVETAIELKSLVKGGKNLQYRFIIDGNVCEDSGYIKEASYTWKTSRPGKYKIDLWVKDVSFEGKYEASAVLEYDIDEMSKLPVKIQEVILDRENYYVKDETINVKVIAAGGVELRYSFIVHREGLEVERIEYGSCSWVNFTPEEAGNYDLEVKVKDKYSNKEYDSHEILRFEVFEYMPALIDYVLMPSKTSYLVGDTIGFDVVSRNTKNTKIKYILRINGHKVEETDYVVNKRYSFTPKHSGNYSVEMLARNEKSSKEFDSKKELKVFVNDATTVTSTKIQCDKTEISANEPVIFSVRSDGGKDVVYEFYLMEQGEWNLVQKYSKKNFYSFIPFANGKLKVLALAKSSYKECAYEDYDIIEFTIE
jgi:hypothetical protein